MSVTKVTYRSDTAAGDDANIGYTAAEGLILTGQGSTNDVTIKNDADADVIKIATGATNVDIVGDVTAATLNADGDTSAGDNAAIGYTAAEGLILTGQGSTDDITVKNDADTTILNVATGATDVEISAGNLLFGTGSKGIYLGVTSATAANLLDDYEEGTFTPSSPGNFSGSVDQAEGHYTKVGQNVTIWCHVRFSATADGSSLSIASLPFTSTTFSYHHHALTQGYTFSDLGPLYPQVSGGTTEVFWYTTGSGSGGDVVTYTEAGTDANAITMSVAGTYKT
jgi:hypothetical protein